MDDEEIIGNVITERSIWKAIRILALPSVIGFFVEDIFNFTDMYFVCFLGPEAISAVSIGGIITNFLINGAGGLAGRDLSSRIEICGRRKA
jgi:Na+-driven multidrug efflux pump